MDLEAAGIKRPAKPSNEAALAETAADTLAWWRSGEAPADPPAGLDRAKEQVLLERWMTRAAS